MKKGGKDSSRQYNIFLQEMTREFFKPKDTNDGEEENVGNYKTH
jgi:hypothetical protein